MVIKVTIPAFGTGAAPTEPRLQHNAIFIHVNGVTVSNISIEFAKNKIAQGKDIAAPSIFTLAPIGNTILAKVFETFPFSVTQAIEIGKVTAY